MVTVRTKANGATYVTMKPKETRFRRDQVGQRGLRTDFECGYKLRECDQEEVEIEEELELFVEYDGQEREGVVLLISNDVSRKTCLQFVCKSRWCYYLGDLYERKWCAPGGLKGIFRELSFAIGKDLRATGDTCSQS
jgi:hypothetical protein